MSESLCPRCQKQASNLTPVDPGLRKKFSLVNSVGQLPNALCSNCMGEIQTQIAQSSVPIAREKSKDESKLKLWKSRVSLLKKARIFMKRKAYGDAVVAYEKYIRICRMTFEVSEEELSPEIFKERMATKELTIITSVYWDLLRVYDTNEKYHDRMIATAAKLTQFAPVTPIVLDIVKKAEAYKKQARNTEIFKKLTRDLMNKRNYCFVATAVFEAPQDLPLIDELRSFRDEQLLKSVLGRRTVNLYYRLSPTLVELLERQACLKAPVAVVLRGVVRVISFLRRC
jgi:hypothetical protein